MSKLVLADQSDDSIARPRGRTWELDPFYNWPWILINAVSYVRSNGLIKSAGQDNAMIFLTMKLPLAWRIKKN